MTHLLRHTNRGRYGFLHRFRQKRLSSVGIRPHARSTDRFCTSILQFYILYHKKIHLSRGILKLSYFFLFFRFSGRLRFTPMRPPNEEKKGINARSNKEVPKENSFFESPSKKRDNRRVSSRINPPHRIPHTRGAPL